MFRVSCLAWLSAVALQSPAALPPLDVSSLTVAVPVVVAEIDTGTLKGEPARLAWSPDGLQFYLQTVEPGSKPERLHHYTMAVAGGEIVPVDQEPAWAAAYWAIKQDRSAPGMPSLEFAVEQKDETLKSGTGPSGVLDRTGSPDAIANASPNAENLAAGAHGNTRAHVVRLSLLGRTLMTWVNERPVPGTRFGWAPPGTGALAYVADDGRLTLFDQKKHQRKVGAVKNAILPAWSGDGARLAYLQKAGRRTFTVAWVGLK
jgi:hypothetical protein